MPRFRQPPPIIHILRDHCDLVRSIVGERGLQCTIETVEGRPNIVAFRFGRLSDTAIIGLMDAIPEQAHSNKAIIGGGDPRS